MKKYRVKWLYPSERRCGTEKQYLLTCDDGVFPPIYIDSSWTALYVVEGRRDGEIVELITESERRSNDASNASEM